MNCERYVTERATVERLTLVSPIREWEAVAMNCERYVTKRATVEGLTLVGPIGESEAVWNELAANGFRVTRSGPYTTPQMFPRAERKRFLIKAEREVK
jgi:hypothetical protein